MSALSGQHNNTQHFIFHGQVKPYFIICLVNVILSIITFGIFIPWALVRTRRYICENMELKGARFAYRARGGTILLSWLFILVVLTLVSLAQLFIIPDAEGVGTLLFILLALPFMIVKGISYHLMMTSLNSIHFNFQTSALRAWWVMIGMPVVMAALVTVMLSLIVRDPMSLSDMLFRAAVVLLLIFVASGVIYGLVYSHLMELIGNGLSFGANTFSILISSKRCIIIFLCAAAIMIPFILFIIWVLVSLFSGIMTSCMLGICNGSTAERYILTNSGWVVFCYLVLGIGAVLSKAYLWGALRNLAMNNLVLGESIRFRSTLTFSGMAPRLLGLVFLSAITLGLAYPWAKIGLLRYLAENTAVVGDLDSVSTDIEESQPEPNVTTRLCSGFVI